MTHTDGAIFLFSFRRWTRSLIFYIIQNNIFLSFNLPDYPDVSWKRSVPWIKIKMLHCDVRESNPGQLLGRQLCSPLYQHRIDGYNAQMFVSNAASCKRSTYYISIYHINTYLPKVYASIINKWQDTVQYSRFYEMLKIKRSLVIKWIMISNSCK